MFWTILYWIYDWLIILLKALVIMSLAGVAGGALTQGLKGEKDPFSAGLGVFVLVGALFLVLAWYGPR